VVNLKPTYEISAPNTEYETLPDIVFTVITSVFPNESPKDKLIVSLAGTSVSKEI
jgi:hypothetical protein